jgi:hypothetical protein
LHCLYETLYKAKFGLLKGKLKGDRLKTLRYDLQQQKNKFTFDNKSNEAAGHASSAVSQITAKYAKQEYLFRNV